MSLSAPKIEDTLKYSDLPGELEAERATNQEKAMEAAALAESRDENRQDIEVSADFGDISKHADRAQSQGLEQYSQGFAFTDISAAGAATASGNAETKLDNKPEVKAANSKLDLGNEFENPEGWQPRSETA